MDGQSGPADHSSRPGGESQAGEMSADVLDRQPGGQVGEACPGQVGGACPGQVGGAHLLVMSLSWAKIQIGLLSPRRSGA